MAFSTFSKYSLSAVFNEEFVSNALNVFLTFFSLGEAVFEILLVLEESNIDEYRFLFEVKPSK